MSIVGGSRLTGPSEVIRFTVGVLLFPYDRVSPAHTAISFNWFTNEAIIIAMEDLNVPSPVVKLTVLKPGLRNKFFN